MSEDLHHDALINALSKQQSGRGVPGIMNPHPADSSGFEQILPFVPVGMRADGPPVGLTPDEVAAVPGLALWSCVLGAVRAEAQVVGQFFGVG
jgi:hypothetical protein